MTTQKRTRLYLDVDGVLNAWYAQNAWGGELRQEVATTLEGNSYWIKWAPALVEALNDLDVDLVWATTWRDQAQTVIAPLIGLTLTNTDVLRPRTDEHPFPSIYWKLAAVQADQARDPGPFVWLDDEIDLGELAIGQDLGGLPLYIEHNLGITPRQIDRIKAYIEKARQSESAPESADDEPAENAA